ncbi:hypothetical protein ACWEQC_39705 [Streptomyces shenzhenensis]
MSSIPNRRLFRVASCNFERNGAGNYDRWLAMHRRLAGLKLGVLCRQENDGYARTGTGLKKFQDSQKILELSGELGPERLPTAVYYDPQLFEMVKLWDTRWPGWLSHPTAVTLRVRGIDVGTAVDLVAGVAHLSYNSPPLRASQAYDVTRFADHVVEYETQGQVVKRKLPVLAVGMDCNSYPDRPVADETPIPRLDQIKDLQHRAHRSYETVPGVRVMDSLPDRTLLVAGLEDVGRYAALNTPSGLAAVAPTVDASVTHGPANRPDRIYTSKLLLPAVVKVEVIEMKGLSDHDIVVATCDLDIIVDICRSQPPLAA